MIETEESIFALLRERRAELNRDVLDADRCFALNEAWLERLRRRPDFDHRVAEGDMILATYTERQTAEHAEPTSATPDDSEPRG